MPNYKNSMIYQIWSPSNPDLIYIGSTTQPLSKRMTNHRNNYKRYLAGTYHYVSSFKVLECGDARIELIECVECKDRKELCRIEGRFIRERDCVNKRIEGRTHEEYYQDNREKIIEHVRSWCLDNKERLKQYKQQWYIEHKEKISEQSRQWYQKNKNKIKKENVIKVVCECGSSVSKGNLTRHKKSKKHINYIHNVVPRISS